MWPLPDIKKLSDGFGLFLVEVRCLCGHSRRFKPEALQRLAGRDCPLEQLGQRMRCAQCGRKVAQVIAVSAPRPRGVPKNPH